MSTIKLQTSDGVIFDVDVQTVKCFGIIKTLLEDCQMDNSEDDIVPLPNVNADILRKVLHWADYHKNDPEQSEAKETQENSTDISSWDAKFLEVDQYTLFDIIVAANYLDIKRLLEVGCKTVANMVKGKAPDVIKKMFNMENNSSVEEEK